MISRYFRPCVVCVVLGATFAAAVAQEKEQGQGQSGTAAAQADYTVGAQDVLRITVFDEPDVSGRFKVDSDGSITFPLVGRVMVGGGGLRAVEEQLAKVLAEGFLINPQVSVEVDQYGSRSVYVLGEVRSPGVYTLQGNMSLIEVLAAAGSTTSAAGNEVQIVRPTDDRGSGPVLPGATESDDVVRVSLQDIRTGKLSEIFIRGGDTVYVPPAERFFVTGQVRSPGSFVWESGTTVLQAISLAGGLTERGSNRGIKILRVVDGEQEELSVGLNNPVEPDDTITVRQRFF